jgi:ribonuclease D
MAEDAVIETPEDLEALVRRIARERVIAVDTEADSFFHYYDKLCLIQIGYKGGISLIDPLALPEGGLAPLAPIFADPGVRKIFHAADYDLYVLHRYGGLKVHNIFDTMLSAQLLGYPAVGLAAIVERHFGVKMSKDQQRTDWSRRPLKEAQISYAASDVEYLIELSQKLERELKAKKRLTWAQAEFEALEEKVWPEREFDTDGYLRIKGAKQLAPSGLAVLKALFLMRDARARELDRPPFKVLGNGTLLDLARNPPRQKRALLGRKGVTDLVVRRLGGEILAAVKEGLDGPEPVPPDRKRGSSGRRRLDRRAEARLDRLKAWRSGRAKELELDPGVFCPNITLEEIAWANPDSAEDCAKLAQVKKWWAESFAAEAVGELSPAEDAAGAPAESDPSRTLSSRGRKRHRGKK